MNSEKSEIRNVDWNLPGNIKEVIAKVNAIRKANPALQSTRNLRFLPVDNEFFLAFVKYDGAVEKVLIVVVNLDLHHAQAGWIDISIEDFRVADDQ